MWIASRGGQCFTSSNFLCLTVRSLILYRYRNKKKEKKEEKKEGVRGGGSSRKK